jgi:hypothetical protein
MTRVTCFVYYSTTYSLNQSFANFHVLLFSCHRKRSKAIVRGYHISKLLQLKTIGKDLALAYEIARAGTASCMV